MKLSRLILGVLMVCGATFLPLITAHAEGESPERKPDLGDTAQGVYFGDVISDSQGSSKSGVTLTVTRIGVNRARITSDYARLPTVEVALTIAMDRILNDGGETVFLLDPSKSPAQLDVSFLNEVSWSGTRQ